ncbi:linker histone H1 and H5 family protein [Reticulomyxa filosa]|uniref:Linker histone H1 and H5 family protein n=1 Tax=Reticulomyxa filosa TaxID=46433 RepID=X6NE99_RETFI|nr:linker histone H1 and H5 family protein [Reticulomyxa filosa]|eukprot:ETO24296.1 linker histone H1 and H5 family protein [Reticulomyxa filosa]
MSKTSSRKRKLDPEEEPTELPKIKKTKKSNEKIKGFVSDSDNEKDKSKKKSKAKASKEETKEEPTKEDSKNITKKEEEKKRRRKKEEKPKVSEEKTIDDSALSYSNCEVLLDKSWERVLSGEFTKPYYKKLKQNLETVTIKKKKMICQKNKKNDLLKLKGRKIGSRNFSTSETSVSLL